VRLIIIGSTQKLTNQRHGHRKLTKEISITVSTVIHTVLYVRKAAPTVTDKKKIHTYNKV